MKELIEQLRGLADGSITPADRSIGICNTLDLHDHIHWSILDRLFAAWPEFSGCTTAPVPSPDGRLTALGTYCETPDKWADDEYGNARRRLCAYLADRLEANDELP